jgi:hypothetical protein
MTYQLPKGKHGEWFMRKLILAAMVLLSFSILIQSASADQASSEHYSMPIAQTGILPVAPPDKDLMSLEDIREYAKKAEQKNAGREELLILFRDEESKKECTSVGCISKYVVLEIHKQ